MQNSFSYNRNVNEYDLRVSPINTSTIKFFRKIGVEEVEPDYSFIYHFITSPLDFPSLANLPVSFTNSVF
jgi:hypothetical protein